MDQTGLIFYDGLSVIEDQPLEKFSFYLCFYLYFSSAMFTPAILIFTSRTVSPVMFSMADFTFS